MMGLIPHTFPLHGKVQSAGNVYVLCLAKVDESFQVITQSIPTLKEDILKITTNGLRIRLNDEGPDLIFNIEMHIAADLKALWLALGADSFSCPFCTKSGRDDFNDLKKIGEKRQRDDVLGVKAKNVHLCSLHGALRITERLIKNAALSAFALDCKAGKKRPRTNGMAAYLTNVLRRKNFKITANLAEVAGVGDLMEEEDELNAATLSSLGITVGRTRKKIMLKLSALNGPQARKIIEDPTLIYKKNVEISENKCNCAEKEEIFRVRGEECRVELCRLCKVEYVWKTYAEILYPLLKSEKIPDRLENAITHGHLQHELNQIEMEAGDWLKTYVGVYGLLVTPYVHIIGTHLREILEEGDLSAGAWSQQGFEACHKAIRRIYRSCTNQGGGTTHKSPLLQVMQHLYRRHWASLRDLSEKKQVGLSLATSEIRSRVVSYLKETKFDTVDHSYESECTPSELFPGEYVDKEARIQWNCRQEIKSEVSSRVLAQMNKTIDAKYYKIEKRDMKRVHKFQEQALNEIQDDQESEDVSDEDSYIDVVSIRSSLRQHLGR
jgi:hypothetical protein